MRSGTEARGVRLELHAGVGHAIRPVAKTVIRAGYGTYRTVAALASEATEQVQDRVAEARAGASL